MNTKVSVPKNVTSILVHADSEEFDFEFFQKFWANQILSYIHWVQKSLNSRNSTFSLLTAGKMIYWDKYSVFLWWRQNQYVGDFFIMLVIFVIVKPVTIDWRTSQSCKQNIVFPTLFTNIG